MKKANLAWDVEDPIDAKLREYNRPLAKHECGETCRRYPDVHAMEDIWDDFELSKRHREKAAMEVVRARGRLNHEGTVFRRYVSTVTGAYILRLETTTYLTKEFFGEVEFDTEEAQIEYYNYCLGVFKFTELKPIRDEDEDEGFFADLEELEGDFFSALEDDDDEEELNWDTGDEEIHW